MKKLIISFDMDNTLTESIRYNRPDDILKVKPKICAWDKNRLYIDIVKDLKAKGHKIVIFTRRGMWENGKSDTIKWLNNNKVPFDEVIVEKPKWDLLVDDRAISVHQGFLTAEIIEGWANFAKEDMKKNYYKPEEKDEK